jgi:16S rRNA (uracil1498-N3)-methyltransferase
MTRRRWIADEFSTDHAVLTGEHAAHLSRILRARIGQAFEVACGDHIYLGTITSVAGDRVEFALGEEVAAPRAVPITLLLAVFKFDRMEWAIEKATELNVTTIVPVIARRTEKHLALAAEKRVERWQRIAREASEQSRRIAPPHIAAPSKLKDALSQCAESLSSTGISDRRGVPESSVVPVSVVLPTSVSMPISPVIPTEDLSPSGGIGGSPRCDLRMVLAENERDVQLNAVLRAHDHIHSLALAVGPEGGWTPDELESFAKAAWFSVSLGDTILRAETAAIAALAIARAEL